MTEWSDEAFCARVEQYADRLGKTAQQACRDAGLAYDYLSKPAKRGRNVGAVYKLANHLKVSPVVLLGFQPEPLRDLDPRKVALVSQIAAQLYVGLTFHQIDVRDVDVSALTADLLVMVERNGQGPNNHIKNAGSPRRKQHKI